jgi:hypothetical protein
VERSLVERRLAAQLLAGQPARSALDVVRHLLAVQAQDPRGARLAIRPRTAGAVASDVDQALADRELVISWLNRGTLHLVCAEDFWWLHALTTPPMANGNARRLAQEGVDADAVARGVAVIEQALDREGPQTRAQLRERVAAAGVRTEGQAMVHLLANATLQGLIVRGPMHGNEHAFALVRDWLGAPPPFDRDAALAELARRYLASHGPATEADLAKWSGLGLRDARRGFQLIEHTLWQEGPLVDFRRQESGDPPPPRLLGAFDPLLMGWASREPILGPHSHIVTVNGLFRPFALVDGKAVATWTINGNKVTLNHLEEIDPADAQALAHDAEDVLRFLEVPPVNRPRQGIGTGPR